MGLGALGLPCLFKGGGHSFKDFCHSLKIALGSMLSKVEEQILELETPGFHYSSATSWEGGGDLGKLVNF